jgi:small subunit ribosomal protein S2
MPNSIPSFLEMLGAGMHFGHRSSRWHPKMKPYIHSERNGVHIINLEKTAELLGRALDFLRDTAAAGGTVLLVGAKEQVQSLIETAGKESGMPYVHRRWLGGTLTNFKMLKENLWGRYLDLKGKKERGELGKYTKKEQLEFAKQIEEMDVKVGGFAQLAKLPEAIFIVDLRTEATAFVEAKDTKVPVVAICDTNVNPDGVAYPIPANDDAVKSVQLITALVAEAIKEGKKLYAERPIAPPPSAPAAQAANN